MRFFLLLATVVAATATAATVPAARPVAVCPDVAGVDPRPVDARSRDAAQKGLDFLTTDTVQWQNQQQCYGCHVQAVTLSAIAVGENNQYDLDDKEVAEVIRGITMLLGGSRVGNGLSLRHSSSYSASRSLGGAAFARFDAMVGPELREDLERAADQLLEMRDDSGAVVSDYSHQPVAIGQLQDTSLAMITWKQAFEATAQTDYLSAVTKAEGWLQGHTAGWTERPPHDIQELNYALLGFDAAGTGMTEPAAHKLVQQVMTRQNEDGGWALREGQQSSAYATGQSLYTLRTLGIADSDPAIARGTHWLIEHQNPDGSWSAGGSKRAEAMWAVLGLVSVDVLSIAVDGVSDGDRVDGVVALAAEAIDNQGGKVKQVQLFVDDVLVDTACGPELTHRWDTASVDDGPHLIELRALNAAGKTARRVLEVFTGPVYLTHLGTRWDDNGTVVTARNNAERAGTIELSIRAPGAEKPLLSESRPATQGPVTFYWGADADNRKYTAILKFVDASGKAVSTERIDFVHADPSRVAESWSSVAGRLAFADGADAANTVVELVDDEGNVVAQTRSTRAGNYRFDGVDQGKYKLRVQKKGFAAEEAEVDAAPAAEAQAEDIVLE